MADDIPEWVTVAEAARRLNIAPRQARRYADRLEDRDRDNRGLSPNEGQDGKGQSLLYVRFAAVEALRLQSEERQKALSGKDGTGEDTPQGQGQDTEGPSPGVSPEPAQPGTLPAVAYRRVIAEQAARIDSLERDKDRLYTALQLAQENLQREQSLRLLAVPSQGQAQGTAEDSPQAQSEAQETAAGTAEDRLQPAEVTLDAGGSTPPPRRLGLWERLWRRK